MSSSETYIQTRFYKKIKFPVLRVLSVLLLLVLCLYILAVSSDSYSPIIILIAMFAVPIIASLRNTWFTLNPLDKRVLTIAENYLKIDNVTIPLSQVSQLQLFIHSFDGLRLFENTLEGRILPAVSEYGNKNSISFCYKGEVFNLVFILASKSAYFYIIGCGKHWATSYLATVKIENFNGLLNLEQVDHLS
jgi:hypothetical protein